VGHEIAGIVTEVGSHVEGFNVGDRVVTLQRISCGRCTACCTGRDNLCVAGAGFYGEALSGGYGDFVVASVRNSLRVPDELPLDVAAPIGCAIGTGLHALRRANLMLGDWVVITGSTGGVGIHAVKLASLMGLRVLAVTSRSEKAPVLLAAGATHVLTPAVGGFHEQVRAMTGGAGAHGVIEIAGSLTLDSSLRSVRAGGRVVLVGNVSPSAVPLNPARLILKEIEMVGSGHATLEDLKRAVQLVAIGAITPIIAATLPRDAAAEAHKMVESRGGAGRVVLIHEYL